MQIRLEEDAMLNERIRMDNLEKAEKLRQIEAVEAAYRNNMARQRDTWRTELEKLRDEVNCRPYPERVSQGQSGVARKQKRIGGPMRNACWISSRMHQIGTWLLPPRNLTLKAMRPSGSPPRRSRIA